MSKYKFHNFDYKFGASLKSILKQNDIASITDLGCGTGAYVKMIEENNIQTQGKSCNFYASHMYI